MSVDQIMPPGYQLSIWGIIWPHCWFGLGPYLIRRRQWHPTPVLLPGKSHGQRRLDGCSPWGHWGLDTTEWLHFHFALSCIGERNGNPLQCSCLENPRDEGAWWAAVYGVAQSQTRLKWLSSSSISERAWPVETGLAGGPADPHRVLRGDLWLFDWWGVFSEWSWLVELSLLRSHTWRRQWHPTPVLLPGKSHGQRSLVGCSPWGREELDTTERLHFDISLSCIREGNGNPLQCSCLENPRDGGAWWAAVYGVAQSQTRLKWLSSSSNEAFTNQLI